MFEPAILQSLEASMPPQPPAMAQEQTWLSPAGEARQRVTNRLTGAFEEQANAWIARLNAIREHVETITPEEAATPAELASLDKLIEDFETLAEDRAIQSARFAKQARRGIKAQFKTNPSVAAVNRDAAERLYSIDKRIVEALLEYALFLRALRAEGARETEGGPILDSPEAWKRYADSLVA